MSIVRILTVFAVLFAYGLPQTSMAWAEEAVAENNKVSPQRILTGTGKPAGVSAGQSAGKKGFLSRELILGAIALAALAAIMLETATDNDKAPAPGTGTTTTTTTTTSTGTGG